LYSARLPISLIDFPGDEPIDQVTLEDDLADMEIAGDGDDEHEFMDEDDIPDGDVSDLHLCMSTH